MPVIILSCLVGGTSLCSNGPGNLVQTLPPCQLTLTWMRSVVVQKDARALPSPPHQGDSCSPFSSGLFLMQLTHIPLSELASWHRKPGQK